MSPSVRESHPPVPTRDVALRRWAQELGEPELPSLNRLQPRATLVPFPTPELAARWTRGGHRSSGHSTGPGSSASPIDPRGRLPRSVSRRAGTRSTCRPCGRCRGTSVPTTRSRHALRGATPKRPRRESDGDLPAVVLGPTGLAGAADRARLRRRRGAVRPPQRRARRDLEGLTHTGRVRRQRPRPPRGPNESSPSSSGGPTRATSRIRTSGGTPASRARSTCSDRCDAHRRRVRPWRARGRLPRRQPRRDSLRRRPGSSGELEARLLDPRGKVVARVVAGDARAPVKSPRRWSAEEPNLYTLVVTLTAARASPPGRVPAGRDSGPQAARQRHGRVMIHGVNRHDHNDGAGGASRELMEADARLMKQHNVNAVRTSHYPNDPYWLDLCEGRPLRRRRGQHRVPRLYGASAATPRTRAPSSSAFGTWSSATRTTRASSSGRWATRAATARTTTPPRAGSAARPVAPAPLRGRDPRRGREPSGRRQRATDFICPMYPSIEEIVTWATTTDDPRPLILCEYSHAMGNCAAASPTTGRRSSDTTAQGGFIWEWLDHGIRA